ncbi:efflux RND transporter periplasmic adaptor subunit [Lysobacter brunescens]|uniref:Efflux RND transporter periplasmic adaptor subunit n=1 Tax=Lysobacter brunescens TaxID=262323 RepID=A0ABW2Y9D3_9GAMM
MNLRSQARTGTRFPLSTLLLGAAIAVVVSACSSEAAAPHGAPPPPEVSVAQVLQRDVTQWNDVTGRVAAVESVELRPRVSGYIERVSYREGDEVRKGQLLFVIDPRPYRAALAQAEANLERARSEARLARSQDARAQALVDARAISREEFDTRKAATAQGNAAVRAAEAAVASARLDLQFTEVRSPIDGRAGRAMVTTGNLAQADGTLLTTVVSLDPVHVYFESDEQAFLRDGTASRSRVRVGLADESGHPHAGIVDFVDNQVDPATGTIRARAVLANPDRRFTPGLFARVQLEGDARTKALLIDDKAVLTDQDRKYVYVLGKGNQAMRKDVVLGRTIDGLRVIESGLSAQDTVIVNGVQKVFFPGMPVVPKKVAMEGAASTQARTVAAVETRPASAATQTP